MSLLISLYRPSCLCLVLFLASQITTFAAPILAPSQAVQIAKQFCQAIGEPVTEVGVAQFPVPDSLDTPKHYWQPRWYVEFPGQATVEVVDSTGVIAFYYNDALERQMLSQPVGQAIAQSDAIANATTAMQATGQNGEIAFDTAQEFLLGETAAKYVVISLCAAQ